MKKVLMTKEEIEKINQLWCLKRRFEELFEGVEDLDKFCLASARYSLYINKVGLDEEQEYLEDFVKVYFEMEKGIVEKRNMLIDIIQSDAFKQENFIRRIRGKKQLHKAQKMCDNATQFEKEFYETTNISLLRVENERWAKEKSEQKEQTAEQ